MKYERSFRFGWGLLGFVVSLPTFIKMLGLGIFFWSVTNNGRTFGQYIGAMLQNWQTGMLLLFMALFFTYWFSISKLIVQFVRAKRLSDWAAMYCVGLAVVVIAVNHAWNPEVNKLNFVDQSSLIHTAFLLSIVGTRFFQRRTAIANPDGKV